MNTAETRTVVARVYIKPDSVMTRIVKAKGGCMQCLWSFIIMAPEAKFSIGIKGKRNLNLQVPYMLIRIVAIIKPACMRSIR